MKFTLSMLWKRKGLTSLYGAILDSTGHSACTGRSNVTNILYFIKNALQNLEREDMKLGKGRVVILQHGGVKLFLVCGSVPYLVPV